MPDISVQFHATPKELLSFLNQAIADHNIHVVVMRFLPFEVREVNRADLGSYFSNASEFRRWALTVDAPHLPVENGLDHAVKNPDHLRLEVGKHESSTLEQSWLSCRTQNKRAFGIWKKIANKLKRQTFQGVTATNKQTGVSAFFKTFRYTEGAKSLEQEGVIMLPPQGSKGPRITLGITDS
jgi:hypothetical protein